MIQPTPLHISEDGVFVGTHQGGVVVAANVTWRLEGTIQGSLRLGNGAVVEIYGSHQGSLHVSAGAKVIVHSTQQGSSHVAAGGLVEVMRTGRLAGSLHVEGLIINRGERGGSVHGNGQVEDEDGGRVRQPTRYIDGGAVYEWND